MDKDGHGTLHTAQIGMLVDKLGIKFDPSVQREMRLKAKQSASGEVSLIMFFDHMAINHAHQEMKAAGLSGGGSKEDSAAKIASAGAAVVNGHGQGASQTSVKLLAIVSDGMGKKDKMASPDAGDNSGTVSPTQRDAARARAKAREAARREMSGAGTASTSLAAVQSDSSDGDLRGLADSPRQTAEAGEV